MPVHRRAARHGDRVRAAPTINSVSPRGLQIGATTTLVIEGADLLPDPKIVLPVPIARQEIKQPATANRLEIEVALDAAVTPGIYQLRVAGGHGISNGLVIGVDELPQRPFAADAGALPVAMHGSVSGGTILRTTFEGKASQPIVVDVEAHRLGSKLNPVVHLFDSRGVQLAWSQMLPAIAGDARIVTKLPADGRYTVELHDALYRGADPGVFRLKMGDVHFADLVFPLGAQRGSKGAFELVGTNLPPGTTVEGDLAGAAVGVAANFPPARAMTGSRPQIVVGDLSEIVERAAGGGDPGPQQVTQPSAIDGRLSAPREEDRYLLPVTPGLTLRFDLVAARAGSPLDGMLAIRKESGEQLAANDDRPTTTDPGLDFKIPDGVEKVVVAIKDLLDRGGPDYVYRLSVAPADRPDFRLELREDRHQVPRRRRAVARPRRAGRLQRSHQTDVGGAPRRRNGDQRRDSRRRERCLGVAHRRRSGPGPRDR